MSDFTPACVRPLYTIGHSTRPASEFIEILRASAVTRVVDIRRVPWSRANPQFAIALLPVTLRSAGLDYVHLGALGGLRARGQHAEQGVNAGWARPSFHNCADYALTPPFREALRELLEMASRQTYAIMCAEAAWWRCHRRIVSDHTLAHRLPFVSLHPNHADAGIADIVRGRRRSPRGRQLSRVLGLHVQHGARVSARQLGQRARTAGGAAMSKQMPDSRAVE